MGGFFSNLLNKQEQQIILLGLDAAGKTTILYKIKQGVIEPTIPMIGFQVETMKYKNLLINSWDVGGSTKLKHFEKFYYKEAKAIIFVVDSNEDLDRLKQSKEELNYLLSQELLKNIPLLVFANKQDISKRKIEEITQILNLNTINDRDWQIQGTCAITGEGLQEGLNWINTILQKKK